MSTPEPESTSSATSFRRGRGPHSLRRNASYSVVPQLVSVVTALVISPFIVHEIGLASYGFWSVIQAGLTYAQVGAGGVPAIGTRLVAGAHALEDRRTVSQVFWFATGTMAAFAALIVVVAAIIALCIPASLAATLPHHWNTAMVAGSVAFGLVLVSKASGSVVAGYQRYDIDSGILTIAQIGWALAIVAALEAGLGLPGLAVGAAVPGVVGLVGYSIAAHRLTGGIGRPVRPAAGVTAAFKSQVVKLQVVAFVGATNAQADRFLLLPFAPLSWIGAFALGARMADALRAFPSVAFGPMVARGSAVFSTEGLPGVARLYESTFRTIVGLGTGGLLAMYGAMYAAVLAWLGPNYGVSAAAATLLGVGYALNLPTGPGTSLALACGRSEFDRDYLLLGLAINLVLTAPLGLAFGPWGVVAATVIGLVVSSLWLLAKIDRWLDLSWLSILRHAGTEFRHVWAGAGIGAVAVAVAVAVHPAGRFVNLVIAAVAVAVAAASLGGGQLRALLHRRSPVGTG